MRGNRAMTIGFVGLGQMGGPMAMNLARSFDVLAADRDPAALARVAGAGATPLTAPSELAQVDALILCLPSATAVEAALFDRDGGLARHLAPGTTVIDTGTSDHQPTLDMHGRLAEMGLRALDAPVSGMQARAEDGTLTMMVGGDAKVLAQMRPALSTMASTILHMGGPGAGQLTKMVNNLLFDINIAALAEILPMAVRLGLDPAQLEQVVNSGTGRSYASEFFLPRILQGAFSEGYPMQAAYKDLVGGAGITARHAIPAPLLAAATATYQQALQDGHGDKDKGAMMLVYERLLGVRFRAGASPDDPD